MKAYCKVAVRLHAFLTLTLDAEERSVSRPGSINPKDVPFIPTLQEVTGKKSEITTWH
jgi:hypothetical protein